VGGGRAESVSHSGVGKAPPQRGETRAAAPVTESTDTLRDAVTRAPTGGISPASERTPRPRRDSLDRISTVPSSARWTPGSTGYEILDLIGAGGMGRVFRARDPRLGRHVALKFIRDNDPALVKRFLKEAQAQARVEHDNVCKVYDAGELDGQPYIAMQLIDGPSLKAMKHDLTLSQRVEVMIKVAEGLHAAHRLGLIHRDIKPSNVMLERTADGSYRPYIMDFGLARDIGGEEHTMTEPLGTPAYMAPEQAMGELRTLDRHTDVYAMGATLYDVLVGRPPFEGATSLDILMRVVSSEVRPLRSVDPSIPADLETIVLKCLEKEPRRRYDSALMLAEDLRRYLDGEPIQARPPTLLYVLRRKARKHRSLVILAGAALVAVLVVLGMWIRAGVEASRREALAEQFGQRVTEVELFMRYATALPAHDMAPEKALIQRRMLFIQSALQSGDKSSEGPGHYALGRGNLALHDSTEAERHLERALAAGYEQPEVHYALGLALGALYQEALDRAQRIEDQATRDARKHEAERRYLAPALQHLHETDATKVESKTYIEGLVALYEKRYEEAAAKAVAAAAESPWLYEAKKLEGDARFAAGTFANDHGQKEQARSELEKAAAAYRVAADMARSDATIHEALAEAWLQLLRMDTWQSRPFQPALEAALAACNEALAANPRSSNAFTKRGRAYFDVGDYELRRGEDPRPTMERGIESGREALRISPEDAMTWDMIGNLECLIGDYERNNGIDPMPSLERAMTSFDEAIKDQPTLTWAWNDGGLALRVRAESEAERGIDPRTSVDRAVQRFERAATLDPTWIGPPNNVIWVLTILANDELAWGRDPRSDATRALESAAVALRLDPKHVQAHDNKGWAQMDIAQYEEATGGDPSASLAAVEESFRTVLSLSPEEPDALYGLGAAAHVRAAHLVRNGGDPGPTLDEGLASLRKAVALDGRAPAIRVELARLEMTAARYAAAHGHDGSASLEAAKETLEQSLAVNARHAPTLAALAELHALRARLPHAALDREVDAGIAAADAALAIYPRMPLATAAAGGLYLARATSRSGAAQKDDARRALELLEAAVASNPLLGRAVTDRLQEARKLRGEPAD
jgi:serine/threonine-protein kinase